MHDPILDPVGIIDWAIDVGIYDLMYSAWGWTIAEIVHFTGLCLLIGTVGMFDLRMMGLVKGLPVGLSFIGPKWGDAKILSLGFAYEQARGAFPGPRFLPSIEEVAPVAPLLLPLRR